MATTPQIVFPEDDLFRSVTYTGDNSADLNSLITDFTITGETATSLTFTSAGQSQTVPRGAYLVYQGGAVTDVYLNENDYRAAFGALTSVADHYHEIKLATGGAITGAPQE